MQDIFNQFAEDYRYAHKLPVHIHKAISVIQNCRTSALGSHTDVCEQCGNVEISYNSCRNRHCPKCQSLSKERWIQNQKHDLLNVGYFHVVITIPDTLNSLVFQNQREMYALLFKASAEALKELALNGKYLGADIGFTSVLHTWGQNLLFHPHIHCVVPGGGIDSLGRWKHSSKKFFLPVKALSRTFRGKFLYYLAQAKLEFHGDLQYLSNPKDFERLLSSLYQMEWVVYCKPPFKTSGSVVEYLGRYTHRVAISNNRILKVENGSVSFKWRDYKEQNQWKIMTVTAHEFIRRFLTHVLPPRFMKIRHYGLLGNRNRNLRLKVCKTLTQTPILPKQKLSTRDLILSLTGRDIAVCSCCGFLKPSFHSYALNSS